MSENRPILHAGRRFRIADRTRLLTWLAAINLATLVSTDADGWPRASAAPLVIPPDDRGPPRVDAHLDRRNPRFEQLQERRPLLYVAEGSQAFVSPGWFPRRPAAPPSSMSPCMSADVHGCLMNSRQPGC
jgi:predicted FMN-binding regulatory protein PaiB